MEILSIPSTKMMKQPLELHNISMPNTAEYEVVKALYHVIEVKDMKTANHCKAVAYYSMLLGMKLGLLESELNTLYMAGILHDIGKIMVDNATLYKTKTLKSNELHQLNEHPRKGMLILETFHLNDSIVDAAWHHHERWDGTGYPDGQKENDIQFMTQIISAADALDAMSTNRVYRKALSQTDIIQEYEKESGKQFNKEICDIIIPFIKEQTFHIP